MGRSSLAKGTVSAAGSRDVCGRDWQRGQPQVESREQQGKAGQGRGLDRNTPLREKTGSLWGDCRGESSSDGVPVWNTDGRDTGGDGETGSRGQ